MVIGEVGRGRFKIISNAPTLPHSSNNGSNNNNKNRGGNKKCAVPPGPGDAITSSKEKKLQRADKIFDLSGVPPQSLRYSKGKDE
mmetsp:Transcript_19852/g.32592  ORF Transcript_19852/g.32592 Transcript_19852/m.32592 type:complete len:85 (+) Transcript_19852:205-459(+)